MHDEYTRQRDGIGERLGQDEKERGETRFLYVYVVGIRECIGACFQ